VLCGEELVYSIPFKKEIIKNLEKLADFIFSQPFPTISFSNPKVV
jgi:hypothetical protein